MSKEINPINIYKSPMGTISLEVKIENETIWLSQEQMATLFGVNRQAITKHINNIFSTTELDQSVSSILEHTAADSKVYKVKIYNLDMIISVGYRVNSQKATHFRQRATQVLRQHIVQGYTFNQQRLQHIGLLEVHRALQLMQQTLTQENVGSDQIQDILHVITTYAQSWLTLHAFDKEQLISKGTRSTKKIFDHKKAEQALQLLKEQLLQEGTASDLFAFAKNSGSLQGIIGNVYQTFDGKDVYPTVEEKAAHLLYFIIKDHPFADGNKRSAAFLFILFLQQYSLLQDKQGYIKINDRGLVALALLIAQSDPKDKNLMIQLVMNLLG